MIEPKQLKKILNFKQDFFSLTDEKQDEYFIECQKIGVSLIYLDYYYLEQSCSIPREKAETLLEVEFEIFINNELYYRDEYLVDYFADIIYNCLDYINFYDSFIQKLEKKYNEKFVRSEKYSEDFSLFMRTIATKDK